MQNFYFHSDHPDHFLHQYKLNNPIFWNTKFRFHCWAATSKVNQYSRLKLETAAVKYRHRVKMIFYWLWLWLQQKKERVRTTCTVRLEHHKLLMGELCVIIKEEFSILSTKQPKQQRQCVWRKSTSVCVFISATNISLLESCSCSVIHSQWFNNWLLK